MNYISSIVLIALQQVLYARGDCTASLCNIKTIFNYKYPGTYGSCESFTYAEGPNMMQLIDGQLTLGYEECTADQKYVYFTKCSTPNLGTNNVGTYLKSGDKCYYYSHRFDTGTPGFSYQNITLEEAKSKCEDFGMSIITFESDEEYLAFMDVPINLQMARYLAMFNVPYWLGLQYDVATSQYLWSNGQTTNLITPSDPMDMDKLCVKLDMDEAYNIFMAPRSCSERANYLGCSKSVTDLQNFWATYGQ